MPWLRSRRSYIPPAAAPVPSSEALRVAALRSSWRRDRWVSKRRLWFRWTLWGLQRYALQISGGVVTLFALGYLLLPMWRTTPEATRAGSATFSPDPAPAVGMSTPAPATPAPTEPLAPLPEAPQTPAAELRLERNFNAAALATPVSPVAGEASAPDSTFVPKLKPENWLHSKEP